MSQAQVSPLLGEHLRAGARMVDFAGWHMPLRFTSDLEEHEAVRGSAGIFDLSHMGQIEVIGPDASTTLDHSFIGRCSEMNLGRAKYTMILAEDGGIIDDLIVYRLAQDEFLVVPNGVNRARVLDELTRRSLGNKVAITAHTSSRGLIAIQGPLSVTRLQELVEVDLSELRYYFAVVTTFVVGNRQIPIFLARTGYTGEDGFEISVASNDAPLVWNTLAEAKEVKRCGLAARDSLRLEAGMPLYGNELTQARNPFEVGMGRLVDFEHEFVGKAALIDVDQDTQTTLIGLRGQGRRAARGGSEIFHDGVHHGVITSGLLSPSLGYPIAIGIAVNGLAPGTEVEVDVRGRMYPMEVVTLPFYKRS